MNKIDEQEFNKTGRVILNALDHCDLDVGQCHYLLVALLATMHQASGIDKDAYWDEVKRAGLHLTDNAFPMRSDA